MSHLDARQRQALAQFLDLAKATDDDVAIAVLESTGWDVQRAVDFVFDSSTASSSASRRVLSTMQPLEIDESNVRPPPRPRPAIPFAFIARPLLAILAYPFHIVSSVMRFVFSILRIPVPQFSFSTLSFYRSTHRTRPRFITRGPSRWLRELEEETGAVSLSNSVAGSSTATDVVGPSTLRARPVQLEEGVKALPDFTLVPYDPMLRVCEKEARIGCVIIVSKEHDDVLEFKRSTLTDPGFVDLLHAHNMVVWGGDVCDQDTWSAAEKLQTTTYPFVAFVALQPRRSPISTSTSHSSPPVLTVLSRHQGPSTASGPTSAQTLCDHLTNQLLPRVTPFLERIHAQQRERERDRQLREEQDRAFQDAARRDRERIQSRVEGERKERERKRMEEEEEERRKAKEEERRAKEERRMEWRRWTRHVWERAGDGPARNMRVAVRLPSGGRAMRAFGPGQTLTSLYAFVDAQLVPERYPREEDPAYPPESANEEGMEECIERQIEKEGEGAEWWGFRLALAYPRKEIQWAKGCKLGDVESLQGGGQVVVEMLGNGLSASDRANDGSDDEYDTEESE